MSGSSYAEAHYPKAHKATYKVRHADNVVRFFQNRPKLARTPAARVVLKNHRWLKRYALYSMDPVEAICYVFGPYCSQAITVARCESDYYPTDGIPDTVASNGQYLGMFQMGDYARSKYGHSDTAYGQALAAYAYFIDDLRDKGYAWDPWECKP